MDSQIVGTIVGTAVAVGGVVAAGGKWALGMAMRQEMQPLREAMLGLSQTARQLAVEIAEAKAANKESRTELHGAVEAIQKMLSNHETRISVLEAQPAAPRPTMRARRSAQD